MLFYNANVKTPHHYSSKWWEWPIMKKPIYYWTGKEKRIYLVGNPVVWWGGFFILIVVCGIYLLHRIVEIKIPSRVFLL